MTDTAPAPTQRARPRSSRCGCTAPWSRAGCFEQRTHELFLAGLVRGTTHLGIGQEAVAAGFAEAMREDDYTFCTYRGHNHTLARGVSMTPMLLELVGRQGALMGGKGGSMHLTSVEHGAMGSYAIVGAHLPIAVGAAWSAQYRGSGQVAVCFFGDGTTNIGAFHEALNLAAVWKAPVVFVCENNQYMEYTPIGDVTAVRAAGGRSRVGLRAGGAGRGRQRRGRGARHGAPDDRPGARRRRAVAGRGGSRTATAGTRAPTRAPTGRRTRSRPGWPATRSRRTAQRLLDAGVEAAAPRRRSTPRSKAAVAAAEAAAREAPDPDPATATTQVWADGGSSWRS